jgi:poly(3-hydroxybutyrate) depolymerase
VNIKKGGIIKAMIEMPEITKLEDGGCIWSHVFETFTATVYVPVANKDLLSETLNYGFMAPYLLVFAEQKPDSNTAISFARENGFEELAASFASSVVFIYPNTNGSNPAEVWKNASPKIFSEIITNSRIHQYYENGVVKAWNRFTNQIDGYFIRGAIFRTCLFGYGASADYIAKNCLNHFEGDGLWGKADIAPVTCFLNGLSSDCEPALTAGDIPVVSYGNSTKINDFFRKTCKYFIERKESDISPATLIKDYFDFARPFRRMIGKLDIDPDLEKDGLIIEPGIETVKTSPDNFGDDKGTAEHKIGYFAFYNEGLYEQEKVPLVLGFHGGGDSCFFFSTMAGWAKIAHRHGFLLVTVENHLNSTATEMVEFVEKLKLKYPIDENRIYATGFSMGGIKTWDIIQEYPKLIAAAAPMDATVDIGENVYFQKIDKEVNTTVSVPIFYAGGEVTPLPELPFQAQKCLNRMKYALELNGATAKYDVKLEDKDNWTNKIWGIDGDETEKSYDETRDATLTMQKFYNRDGKLYNIFASISGQGHDCREHTCEHAWQFMSRFSRDKDGRIVE